MRTLLPVALALAALSISCSTTREGPVYERGTLTRPPPAQHRPGVGAPTYDPHVKPLPPQPQPKPTRVLPQTPETRRGPGLWAGDAPKAAKKRLPQVISLGVVLPYPPELYWDGEIPFPAEKCALTMDAAMYGSNKTREVKSLPLAIRECLSARLHLRCMETELGSIVAQRKADGGLDEPDDAIESLMRFVTGLATSKCTPASRAASEPLYDEVMQYFMRDEEEE